MYLAAAGVGRLGIVDKDTVDLNNLHRQIAHRESTVGTHKADSAAFACRSINSSIQVRAIWPLLILRTLPPGAEVHALCTSGSTALHLMHTDCSNCIDIWVRLASHA